MRLLCISFLAIVLGTSWGCKNKIGEKMALDYLVRGDIEIEKDPSGRAPLTALAKINTTHNVMVEVTVEGDHPLTFQATRFEKNPEVPVIGLYPNTTNTVRLKLTDLDENWAETTLEIETDSLPGHFPETEITTIDENLMAEGLTLCEYSYGLGTAFRSNPMLVDNNGAVRWYLDLEFLGGVAFPIRVKDDGKMWVGRGEELLELDWLGREQHSLQIPGYTQHHEIQEMPNGNLLLAVAKQNIGTVDDHIIEVGRNGNIITEWDFRELLDVNRTELVNDTIDWFHMNAVFYDEEDEALIVSGRNQGVVKVDWDNNLQWILAPHKGWGKAGIDGNGFETSNFLLTAVDANGSPYATDVQNGDDLHSDFDWSWGQHAPMILPNGNLFVYDNGYNRQFTKPASFSRAVEYSVDEADKTVTEEWQYGKERGEALQSIIISDVDLLENDNRLMASGIILANNDYKAKITEVQYPSGQEVFELTLHFKNAFCSGAIEWGNFDMMYRAERVDLGSVVVMN